MNTLLLFYSSSVIASALPIVPISISHYKKNPQHRDKMSYLSLYLGILVPLLNLFLTFVLLKEMFIQRKHIFQEQKRYETSPYLASIDMLKQIKDMYARYLPFYPNKVELTSFMQEIHSAVQKTESHLNHSGVSLLLIQYEMSFANVIAILKESEKLERDMLIQLIGESYLVLQEFFEELDQIEAERKAIENESIEAIRTRFSSELEKDRLNHQNRKKNSFENTYLKKNA